MAKKRLKLLFAADVHGNTAQYTKIFNKAVVDSFDAVILGGDLCPKGAFTGSMDVQREFLKTYLIPRLEDLSTENDAPAVYLMMGNDDWAGNIDVLEEQDGKLLRLLDKGPYNLNRDFDICGYPYVPVTPFRMKDWEKWDMAVQNEIELERSILLQGIVSREKRYQGKRFNQEDRHDSIENDMKKLFPGLRPDKTIFVSHAPPFNTDLDMLYSREHIGSLAIRMAIERHQPVLTLHGHIHETVDISGEFIDRIKKTVCASVGNHNIPDRPHVLTIGLPEMEIRRIRLD